MSSSATDLSQILFAPEALARPSISEASTETLSPLRVVGLFAGIGGMELGLNAAGHATLELCEIDPSARAVLRHHFRDIHVHEDVRFYRSFPADAELIAAGFPCQDLSQAGRTLGLDGDRSSLVSEVFAIARRHETPWLLLENVPFMLQLGRGRAMEVILRTLEELEYNWAYRVVDSRAFGLPQRRKRVFILASKEYDPRRVLLADTEDAPPEAFDPGGKACGFYWTEGSRGLGWAVDAVPTLKGGSTVGIPSPPAVWLRDGSFVTPGIRDAERIQGFDPDWTLPAEAAGRASLRWKLVGNAVTVDVVEWIGNRLLRPARYVRWGDQPILPGQKWPDAAYNVGDGRFAAPVSQFPERRPARPLHDFLQLDECKPLSPKATAGFLRRFEASTLKRPAGFVDALRRHHAKATAGCGVAPIWWTP